MKIWIASVTESATAAVRAAAPRAFPSGPLALEPAHRGIDSSRDSVTTASMAMSFGPTGTAIDELYVEGAGDACGARRNERQETVVVAATIAKPPPFAIERDARNYDEVDLIGRNSGAVGQRLGNAPESRADVAREVGNLMEVEHPRVAVDARNRDGLACGHGSAHEGRGVPFIVKGERHQYAAAPREIGARQEACDDADGSRTPGFARATRRVRPARVAAGRLSRPATRRPVGRMAS